MSWFFTPVHRNKKLYLVNSFKTNNKQQDGIKSPHYAGT